MPAPPSPFHVLRHHQSPLHHLAFSHSNDLLYSGDEDGNIAITDLKLKRVISSWKAHGEGVLGVGEWDGGLVSQGRDNVIHFHSPLETGSTSASASSSTSPPAEPSQPEPSTSSKPTVTTVSAIPTITPLLPPPRMLDSLPTNSLNFCKFALVEIPEELGLTGEKMKTMSRKRRRPDGCPGLGSGRQGLLAVPNLMDSDSVDIYHLPTLTRLHAAFTHDPIPTISTPGTEGQNRNALIMGIHLYFHQDKLRTVLAFEDGRVEVWECDQWDLETDIRLQKGKEGVWRCLWREKGHNEAIMAMSVSPKLDFAFTVSADHQLVRYNLENDQGDVTTRMKKHATKQIGNADVKVDSTGKIVAVAGWDGSIRLFSVKSFKSLGTLAYHRDMCNTLVFPFNETGDRREGEEDSEDEEYGTSSVGRARKKTEGWLVSGGKDRRIAIWQLKDFTRR
ncbi:WD40-repeat-containing domain protein [Filobasidium floriforme]|uniref:WD40-repeat-containing domain protein n=1 Tax=Filobasidium floriforme TaxID=5210 RepID=UPI001E8E9F55|nr:WD40-repeat-containing domain protein [Filobasidium floriforme]KAH8089136.1 WD40-repeat-containing domain protein [Filobasidium floriforme]